jgi:restriction system protein
MIFPIIIVAIYIRQNFHWIVISVILFFLKKSPFYKYVKLLTDHYGWSMQQGSRHGSYRRHWEKEKVLSEIVNGPWTDLSLGILSDGLFVIRNNFKRKKEKLIQESNSVNSKILNNLSCSDFENLLCRLFEAMGYAVQKTDKVDDQGCDLVINLGDQKLLIQAKLYKESPVEHSDIQNTLAEEKKYGCNGAMVVTNSNYTKEARELANMHGVGLVGKDRLRKLLLQYLNESWN